MISPARFFRSVVQTCLALSYNPAWLAGLVLLSGMPGIAIAETQQTGTDKPASLYAVRIGTLRSRSEADKLVQSIPAEVHRFRILQVEFDNGTRMYRVISQRFTDRSSAEALNRTMRARGISSYVYRITNPLPSGSRQFKPDAGAKQKHSAAGSGNDRSESNGEVIIASSPKDPFEHAYRQALRQGDKRPEDQFRVELFGRPLTIGGEYGLNWQQRNDFELEGDAEDDLHRIDQGIDLEFFYKIDSRRFAFASLEASRQDDTKADGRDKRHFSEIERGEMWLFFANLYDMPVSLQIGRQNISDKREWFWDTDLDALRLHFNTASIDAEVAIAEELFPVVMGEPLDPEDDDIFRLLAQVKWDVSEEHRLSAFFHTQTDHSDSPAEGSLIDSDDEDDFDADLTWFGIRARGKWKLKPLGKFYYWADYARVFGRETAFDFDDDIGGGRSSVDSKTSLDVDGWAFDIGATLRTRLPRRPTLTIGYAMGSGDSDRNDDTNEDFQQTGLHGNNGKFRGVDRFRYYGELLRPELSNLRILTLATGVRFWKNSSVELLYHHYEQVEAADFLRDARIKADPLGTDTDIGEALELVLGLEEWKHLELELVTAVFRSGKAYGDLKGKHATHINFKLNYNF